MRVENLLGAMDSGKDIQFGKDWIEPLLLLTG